MYDLPDRKLFLWQEECLDLWFKNNCRGIVNVVTGAGKTLLALGAVYNLKNLCSGKKIKIKVVVPKVFLAHEWVNSIKDKLLVSREQIGLYTGAFKDKESKDYMIYVINSARYNLSKHIVNDMKNGYSVMLICDECHHCGSRENAKIFEFLPFIHKYNIEYFSLGLSATPESENYHNILVPALGKEIFKYDFNKAVKAKVISKYSIFNIELNFLPDEFEEYIELSDYISLNIGKLIKLVPSLNKTSGTQFYFKLKILAESANTRISLLSRLILNFIYKRKELVYHAKSRIDCVYSLIQNLNENSKIIIFGERIQMVDELYQKLIKKYPCQVGRYHSEMNETARKISLYKYQNSETRILVCCKALDEGLNVPMTDVGIILSSTGSVRQRIQRIGRILRRTSADVKKAIYYLHIGDSSEENDLISSDISGNMKIYNLKYNNKTNDFSNFRYDEIAEKILSDLTEINIDPTLINEMKRNLEKGKFRCDWELSESECIDKINKSDIMHEKNYWIAMLYMVRGRVSGDSPEDYR